MKNLKHYILIAAIAVLFGSCAKDGAPGATGPAGANGNANVKERTITVSSNAWSSSNNVFTCIQTDADITDATKDLVEIAVSSDQVNYINLIVGSYFTGVPIGFEYKNGQITFVYGSSVAPTQTLYFKVTVIPPS